MKQSELINGLVHNGASYEGIINEAHAFIISHDEGYVILVYKTCLSLLTGKGPSFRYPLSMIHSVSIATHELRIDGKDESPLVRLYW